jgi:hypothetical protein
MTQFKQKFSAAALTAGAYLGAAVPVSAQTSAWSGVCVDTAGGNTDVATLQGLQCLLANVLSIFLTVVGIAAFIMLIVAAFQFLTSGGNSQTTEKAQKAVTYAVIGLIVAVSAFAILNLIASFTGVNTILQFKIPGDTPSSTPSVFIPAT